MHLVESRVEPLDARFEARLSERIESTINHIDTRLIADETRQKTIEVEVGRIINGKLNQLFETKMAQFKAHHETTIEKGLCDKLAAHDAAPSGSATGLTLIELARVRDKLEQQFRGAHLILRNIRHECDGGQTDL